MSLVRISFQDGTEETLTLPWTTLREVFVLGFFEGKRVAEIALCDEQGVPKNRLSFA